MLRRMNARHRSRVWPASPVPTAASHRDLRPGQRRAFARENGVEFLGSIPLDTSVRQGADVGIPAVAQREPGPAARAMTTLAKTVAARMSVAAARSEAPILSIT